MKAAAAGTRCLFTSDPDQPRHTHPPPPPPPTGHHPDIPGHIVIFHRDRDPLSPHGCPQMSQFRHFHANPKGVLLSGTARAGMAVRYTSPHYSCFFRFLSVCVCVRALYVDRYRLSCSQSIRSSICPSTYAPGCWLLRHGPSRRHRLLTYPPKHAPRPSMAACRALPSSAGWNLRPRPSGPVWSCVDGAE